MKNIRSTNTKPELIIRKYIHSKGYRYRKNVQSLPGCPDIAIKKYAIAIFINGCYWHQHENCRFSSTPKSNLDYWQKKLQKNIERDKKNYKKLEKLKFHILIIWECEIKKNIYKEVIDSFFSEYYRNGNP